MSAYSDIILSHRPVGYWRMGESSGNIVDQVAARNGVLSAGTITYGATGLLTGDSDKSITYNATGSFAVPDDNVFDVASVWTIEAWIKLHTTGMATLRVIMGKGEGSYEFRVDTDNKLHTWRDNGLELRKTTSALSSGTIYHVAAVKNGNNFGKIYVNGVDDTAADVGNDATGDTSQSLRIGGKQNSGAANGQSHFYGDLDEVALYNYVLSPTQIIEHYKVGTATFVRMMQAGSMDGGF